MQLISELLSQKATPSSSLSCLNVHSSSECQQRNSFLLRVRMCISVSAAAQFIQGKLTFSFGCSKAKYVPVVFWFRFVFLLASLSLECAMRSIQKNVHFLQKQLEWTSLWCGRKKMCAVRCSVMTLRNHMINSVKLELNFRQFHFIIDRNQLL